MSEKNKALIRAFVEAINAEDWSRLRSLVDERFARIALRLENRRSIGRGFSCLSPRGVRHLPRRPETLLDLVAEGDKVAARHQFRGTQFGPMGPYAASGRVLVANYLAIYRIENERIVEAWAEWDNLAGLRQLGHHLDECHAAAANERREPTASFEIGERRAAERRDAVPIEVEQGESDHATSPRHLHDGRAKRHRLGRPGTRVR